MRPIPLMSAALVALLVTGCGGGGSSPAASAPADIDLTGQVATPGAGNARVVLRDGSGSARSQVVISDAEGQFTVRAEPPGDDWSLLASGGQVLNTGLDLQGVTLRRQLDDTDLSDRQIISALSTVAAALIESDGSSAAMAAWLDVEPSIAVADPAVTATSQRLDLQLSQALAVLRTQSGALMRLTQALKDSNGDVAAALGLLAQNDDFPNALRQRLEREALRQTRVQALPTDTSAPAMLEAFNRLLTREALLHFIDVQLGSDPSLLDEEAVSQLAQAVWSANNQRGLQPESATATNVSRYVLREYDIEPGDLIQGFQVPGALQDDSLIASLARRNVIDTTLPLASAELLGMNNEARFRYFLGSDQSPFFQAEQLFDNIVDDTVLDPVLRLIAAGLADAGILEDAELIVSSRIFDPLIKADAFRRIGRAAISVGATEQGIRFLDDAIDIMVERIDRIGLANITFDDTRLLQNLSTDLGAIGEPDKANAALAPIRDFVQTLGGQSRPFSGSFSNLTAAVMSLADDNVLRAEESGMDAAQRQQAIDTVDLLRDLADNFPGVGSPVIASCLLAAQYTARYGDLYRRLGLENDAVQATATFKSYFTDRGCDQGPLAANVIASMSGSAALIAPVYPTYGLDDAFETQLALLATDFWRDNMRDAARVFQARNLVVAGDTPAAIALLENETSNLVTLSDNLTFDAAGTANRPPFTGISGRVLGARRLFALSLDDNDLVSAAQISDAAWDLSVSEAFLNAANDQGNNAERRATLMFTRGCMRASLLALLLDDQMTARDRVRDCRDLINDRAPAATTANQIRIDLLSRLSELFADSGLDDEALQLLDEARQLASQINNPGSRASALAQQVAALQAHARGDVEAVDTLQGLPAALQSALSDASTEAERLAALRAVRTAAGDINNVRNIIRRNITRSGQTTATQTALIDDIEALLRHLANGEEGGFSGLIQGAQSINNPQDRATVEALAAEVLLLAGDLEGARDLALAASGAERNRRLESIAGLLLARDDFPGTSVARFDFDGDGRPDFFSPQASASDIAGSGLTLDPDIDGDGIPDDIDETPYCAQCGTQARGL